MIRFVLGREPGGSSLTFHPGHDVQVSLSGFTFVREAKSYPSPVSCLSNGLVDSFFNHTLTGERGLKSGAVFFDGK